MSVDLDFDELLTTYLYDLYSMAFRLTGSKESAEDLIQDLYVNLKMKDYQTRHVNNPKAWLASILYRLFVDQWRKESRNPITLTDGHLENEHFHEQHKNDGFAEPSDAFEQSSLNKLLQNALDKLNEKHKDVVIMHDVEGYTLHELHIIMDVPVGTLKSRLHRGRDKLQEIIGRTRNNNLKSNSYY